MKSFKEWVEESHKIQASGKSYPVAPIRRPEDLHRASNGDNYESHHFDAIRHNAKLDAGHAKATGDAKKIHDNEKMQHAGEVKFDLTEPLDRTWAKNLSPESAKHAVNDHNKKHGTKFKDLKGAMDHGRQVQLERIKNGSH